MKEIFLALIGHLNSSVFVLISILFAAFYILFKAGSFKEKFKNQDNKIEKLEELSDTVIEMKTKLDLIYDYTNPNRLSQSHSPISLTAKGEEIKKLINAEDIFNRILPQLKNLLPNEKLKNAYDIQMQSIKVAKENFLKLLTEQELIKVKDVAFSQGLIVDDFYIIIGLMLRNKILEEKNIPISDVDKHNPQNKK